MDKTTFMIFDALSSGLGRSFSINGLTSELRKDGKAYYKNVFDRIKVLEQEEVIILEKVGKSSIVRINFDNYGALNLLAELELVKKGILLAGDREFGMLISELCSLCSERFSSIDSISIIRPDRNKALNRAEFLILLKRSCDERDERPDMLRLMKELGKIHNTRLDCLILKESEFKDLLKESAHNPLKEMIREKTVLAYQENFWQGIKRLMDEGISINGGEEINPAKIDETDLAYNLARFGYKEMGGDVKKGGRDFCIETLITALLLSADARRKEAVPVIIAKNLERGRGIIFGLLVFLAEKYGKAAELLAALEYLEERTENEKISKATALMKGLGVKAAKLDKKAVKQKMELYNGN